MTTTKNEELRLRAERLRISKKEIAEQVGRSRTWVTQYLNGNEDSSLLGDEIERILDQQEKQAA